MREIDNVTSKDVQSNSVNITQESTHNFDKPMGSAEKGKQAPNKKNVSPNKEKSTQQGTSELSRKKKSAKLTEHLSSTYSDDDVEKFPTALLNAESQPNIPIGSSEECMVIKPSNASQIEKHEDENQT